MLFSNNFERVPIELPSRRRTTTDLRIFPEFSRIRFYVANHISLYIAEDTDDSRCIPIVNACFYTRPRWRQADEKFAMSSENDK